MLRVVYNFIGGVEGRAHRTHITHILTVSMKLFVLKRTNRHRI